MHCCVNSPGQKSSFPSQQHSFSPVHCSRTDLIVRTAIIFNYIDRWLLRPLSSVGRSPAEYLQKAKLSERGTKHRGIENGKGRNWYHVTSLMWTATAGDGSQIFSAMRMSDPASLGFRSLDRSLNPPKHFLSCAVILRSRGSRHFRHRLLRCTLH